MTLAEVLGLGNLIPYGSSGGGCINEGTGYTTLDGMKIFVKKNNKAEVMAYYCHYN